MDVVLEIAMHFGGELQSAFGGQLTYDDLDPEPPVTPGVAAVAEERLGQYL